MHQICFVIDSMSTFDEKIAKMENIEILHYFVNDSKANLLEDDFSISQKSMIINQIETKENLYKTSFLNNDVLQDKFDSLLKKYNKVIYLCASEGYTGQYPNAKKLLEQERFQNRLFIVDTISIASTIESLLYILMEKYQDNDDVKQEELDKIALDVSKRSIILFSPKNLIGMVNSGRVPILLAKLMKLTKIHPVIKCEEKNKATGIVFRKWNDALTKICDGLNKIFDNKINSSSIYKIYFYCSLITEQEKNEYVDKLAKFFKIDPNLIEIRNTPLPILIYTLKDSIGVGITLKENLYRN